MPCPETCHHVQASTACRSLQKAERFGCGYLRHVAMDYVLCNLNRNGALASEVSQMDSSLKQILLSAVEERYGLTDLEGSCEVPEGGCMAHLRRIRSNIDAASALASDNAEVQRVLQAAGDDILRAYVGLWQMGDDMAC